MNHNVVVVLPLAVRTAVSPIEELKHLFPADSLWYWAVRTAVSPIEELKLKSCQATG